MSNLTIFDPFKEMMSMRSMFDDMFDNMLSRHEGWRFGDVLPVDMYQTKDDVVVKATMPGIKPTDISVSVTNQVLTIRGEVKEEKISDDSTYHLRERRIGNYTRSVQLPVPVVSDRARAEFEDGILTLTLPKAEEVKPKTITVKVK